MSIDAGRKWHEKRIAGGETLADGLFVRVAIGEQNDAYADFEISAEQIDADARPPQDLVRRYRVASGFIKSDGCVNADLTTEDGVMQHWCDEEGIAAFGRALLEAHKMAAGILPGWVDEEAGDVAALADDGLFARVGDPRARYGEAVLRTLLGWASSGVMTSTVVLRAPSGAPVAQFASISDVPLDAIDPSNREAFRVLPSQLEVWYRLTPLTRWAIAETVDAAAPPREAPAPAPEPTVPLGALRDLLASFEREVEQAKKGQKAAVSARNYTHEAMANGEALAWESAVGKLKALLEGSKS